jgi:hypothetical protein
VTQAFPQWQRWANQVGHQFDSLWHSKSFNRVTEAVEQKRGWLLCLAIGLLLCIWNWQLVVSSGAGLGALVGVYLIYQGQWHLSIRWRRLWHPSLRPVIVALCSGVVVSVGTYVSLALWIETHGSWVAKGLILQGIATTAVLVLLGWQTIDRVTRCETGDSSATPHASHRTVERLLNELSDADALKRLLAVRRLTQWVRQQSVVATDDREAVIHGVSAPLSVADLTDCFRLMLNRETDPAVCRALLDSLHQIKPPLNSQVSLPLERLPFSPKMPSTATKPPSLEPMNQNQEAS